MEASKLRIYSFAVVHKQWTLVVGYWCSPNGNNSFMPAASHRSTADAMFYITINCIIYEINSVVNAAAIQSTYICCCAQALYAYTSIVDMLYAISITIIV